MSHVISEAQTERTLRVNIVIVKVMFKRYIAASIRHVSDCNQFLQEQTLLVHGYTETLHTPEHVEQSITQHAGNSCKLPLQRYNYRYFYQLD